jgi:mono/diheme cytochrome c family protein
LPNVFPPIAKTEYVIGDPKRFAAMVLKGVAGPITVDGKLYTNMMPGQEALLTDEKIAAVLTYVRASFGNQAPAVSAEVVKSARAEFAERKTPWTEAELKAFPSDAAAVEQK